MKILTWNVNGYKSAYEKGDLKKILNSDYDIICLQEVKNSDIDAIKSTIPNSYNAYFNECKRKGHNGVMVLSKNMAESVDYTIQHERFDEDGRLIKCEFNDFILFNLYMIHGGRQKENLKYKLEVCNKIEKIIKNEKKNIIIATDFNIAHNDIDLARPKQNHKNIMFTDEERKVVDDFINLNLIDAYRTLNKNGEEYTWYPYAFDARNRNLGWRIDYFFVSKSMQESIKNVKIYKDIYGSDHVPMEINIKETKK